MNRKLDSMYGLYVCKCKRRNEKCYKAVYVALGMNIEGNKEVLDFF